MRLYILGIVLIISAFFFFYNLDTLPPGLYIDEAMNGIDAQSGEIRALYPENGGREGLFIILQSLALGITGVSEPWVLRMVSGIIGLIGIGGVFFFLSSLFYHLEKQQRYLWAGGGSLLVAMTLWYTILSRLGFRALLASTILIWTLVILQKAFHEKRIGLFVGAGLLGGLGMYSYSAYYIAPFIFLLYMWIEGRSVKESRSSFIRQVWYFFSSYIVVSIPLFFSLSSLSRFSEVSVLSQEHPVLRILENIVRTGGMFFFQGDMNARHNIPGLAHLSPLLGIFFIGMFLYYLFARIQKKTSPLISMCSFLYGWMILGSIPALFSSEGIPHALRSVLLLVPSVVVSFLGVYVLYTYLRTRFNRTTLLTGAMILFLVFGISQGYLLFSVWGHSSDTWNAFSSDVLETAYAIRTIDPSIPVYVVVYRNADQRYRDVARSVTPLVFINPQRDIIYVSDDEGLPTDAVVFYVGEKEN